MKDAVGPAENVEAVGIDVLAQEPAKIVLAETARGDEGLLEVLEGVEWDGVPYGPAHHDRIIAPPQAWNRYHNPSVSRAGFWGAGVSSEELQSCMAEGRDIGAAVRTEWVRNCIALARWRSSPSVPLPKASSCSKSTKSPAEECLTALGGIPLFVRTARSLDVPGSVKRNLAVKQRDRGFDEATYIESFLVLNAAGGDCLEDFDCLREDRGLAAMLGHEVPSPEAARKFLYQFHDPEKIEQAQQELADGRGQLRAGGERGVARIGAGEPGCGA